MKSKMNSRISSRRMRIKMEALSRMNKAMTSNTNSMMRMVDRNSSRKKMITMMLTPTRRKMQTKWSHHRNQIKVYIISNISGFNYQQFEARKWQWATPLIEGVPPCPRGGHSATLSGASIVIFGGHYYAGKTKGYIYLNDTYVLDVNANRWHVLCHYIYTNRNPKYQEHHQVHATITHPSLLVKESSSLVEREKNPCFVTYMPSTQSR